MGTASLSKFVGTMAGLDVLPTVWSERCPTAQGDHGPSKAFGEEEATNSVV